MLQELSCDMTYEMLNSADTSSLKVELKGKPAGPPLPQLSCSVSARGCFDPSRALQLGGTERNGSVCLRGPRKNLYFFLLYAS